MKNPVKHWPHCLTAHHVGITVVRSDVRQESGSVFECWALSALMKLRVMLLVRNKARHPEAAERFKSCLLLAPYDSRATCVHAPSTHVCIYGPNTHAYMQQCHDMRCMAFGRVCHQMPCLATHTLSCDVKGHIEGMIAQMRSLHWHKMTMWMRQPGSTVAATGSLWWQQCFVVLGPPSLAPSK
jgi:hypothetical protein